MSTRGGVLTVLTTSVVKQSHLSTIYERVGHYAGSSVGNVGMISNGGVGIKAPVVVVVVVVTVVVVVEVVVVVVVVVAIDPTSAITGRGNGEPLNGILSPGLSPVMI